MSVRISRVDDLPPATNDRLGLVYRVGDNAYICLSDGVGGYEWREITFADDPVMTHDHDADYASLARVDLGQSETLYPVGFQAANLTTETAAALSGITIVQYLGHAPRALTTLTLRCRVTTAAVTITWAEVAVLTGALGTPGVGPTLGLSGFIDVAATFNSTGLKNTAITLTGVDAGDEIWLAWGSSATTPFRLRAGLGDDLSGGTVALTAVRPSLVSSTGFAASNTEPAWIAAFI